MNQISSFFFRLSVRSFVCPSVCLSVQPIMLLRWGVSSAMVGLIFSDVSLHLDLARVLVGSLIIIVVRPPFAFLFFVVAGRDWCSCAFVSASFSFLRSLDSVAGTTRDGNAQTVWIFVSIPNSPYISVKSG